MMNPTNYFAEPLIGMADIGVTINAILLVLNLLPLPPLDGGRIAVSLLPRAAAYRFAMVEPYGMIILLVLMFLGVLGAVMMPFVGAFIEGLAAIFDIGWIFGIR
jgi:Zn-dependent protease